MKESQISFLSFLLLKIVYIFCIVYVIYIAMRYTFFPLKQDSEDYSGTNKRVSISDWDLKTPKNKLLILILLQVSSCSPSSVMLMLWTKINVSGTLIPPFVCLGWVCRWWDWNSLQYWNHDCYIKAVSSGKRERRDYL